MKHLFKICDLRFAIWKKSGRAVSPLTAADGAQRSARPTLQPSTSWRGEAMRRRLNLQHSQRGVALIITVILLSVLTLMVLAFLAVSRRERGAVTTTTDTASARLAADAALANAEAQIVANALATTNPYNFGLIVSTNAWPLSFTNTWDLTNLYISPRTQVWLSNTVTHAMENRFYLDLNRNGVDDPNGWLPETNSLGQPAGATNFMVGDPEWIGVLQRPDQPYGPNNPFVARFAFIAVPIGNALDLNAIHNYAMGIRQNGSMASGSDEFMRNQGVGSWEINLAAFLTDLNTNQWDPPTIENPLVNNPYNYQEWQTPNFVNKGAGFEDALSLLSYRYDYNYNNSYNLASVDNLFGGPGGPGDIAFKHDNVDGYSDGPLQTTFNTNADFVADDPSKLWSGADNTNHFFTHQELFDPNKTSGGATGGFTNRLLNAGTNVSTYDRYTFYRLLSQLGTDSTPEQNKINLNYRNVTNGVVVPNLETNFYSWTAIEFFTNAADKMLRTYTTQWRNSNPTKFATTFYAVTNFNFVNPDQWTNYPAFGITNIPVLVSNQFVYTPAIQRVLQLAANIYDATTNSFYPSVFRPTFWVANENSYTNVYINGYEQVVWVTGTNDAQLNLPIDVTSLSPGSIPGTGLTYTNVNIYGVPWIIGAKKGFPNFNEFAMDSAFQLTRKMEATRPNTNAILADGTYSFYQMFNLNITNQLGVECWNSYTNNFTDPVAIYVTSTNSITLTNDEINVNFGKFGYNVNFSIPASLFIPNATNSVWPGYTNVYALASFQIPLNTSATVIPDSTYVFNSGGSPYLWAPPQLDYETNYNPNVIPPGYPQPHWWLMTANNLQVIMLDTVNAPGPVKVIDYVQLRGPNSVRDLTGEILANYNTGVSPQGFYDQWDTNLDNFGMPYGLDSQIGVSQGQYGLNNTVYGSWNQTGITNLENGIDAFLAFCGVSTVYNNVGGEEAIAAAYMTNAMQLPFTPTATVYQHITWQANDPLVHYIASDLSSAPGNGLYSNPNWPANLGLLNDRYMPWGGNPIKTGADPYPYNFAIKDSLVTSSDSWDFPTNKFPTIGWLGRIHRGTPWQTVYMKSSPLVDLGDWVTKRTGDTLLAFGQYYYDATNMAPAQDRLLFDLFTTAFNDNATRGTLSVNVEAGLTNNPQAGLAAWSALFSGVVVPTNTIGGYTIVQPAGPAGSSSWLGELVTNINITRATFTNSDGLVGSFEHVGDILAAPELTVSNQWILLNNTNTVNGISDEMYEWLPQQVMSLLRCSGSPRYVIYSYGQTLKPAQSSLVTSGGNLFGMCTNYQIVSEAATRAVVRFGSTLTNVITTNNASGSWFTVPMMTNNNAVIERFNVLPPDYR
jgi:Flp pilus assembly protein TadG